MPMVSNTIVAGSGMAMVMTMDEWEWSHTFVSIGLGVFVAVLAVAFLNNVRAVKAATAAAQAGDMATAAANGRKIMVGGATIGGWVTTTPSSRSPIAMQSWKALM